MGDYKMIDTMIKDGLWDAFNGYHMGTTAENVAKQWQITREQQDDLRRRAFRLAGCMETGRETEERGGKATLP